MILVTLGTQDKEFVRLLKAIDKEIEKGTIKDEVIVQAGCTKYKSKNMKIYDLIEMKELENLTKKCDLLITHGGVGSILSGLTKNKKVIAAARLEKYNEHRNDHQKQIISEFVNRGYLLELEDFNKLGEVLEQIKKFKPKKYKSNNKEFIKGLDNYIEDTNHISWYNKYRNLTSYGYNGIIINLINIILFSLLLTKFSLLNSLVFSFIISFIISLLFNIFCDIKIKDKLVKYIFIKILSLILDIIIIYLFCNCLNLGPILAKVLSSIVIIFISLFIIKNIVGKEEI